MAEVIATEKGYFGGLIREEGARFHLPDALWRDKKLRPSWVRLDPAHAFGGKGDHDGDGNVGGSVAAAVEPDAAGIEIPADWREAHHKKRKSIAKQITGNEPANTEDADRVIAAYLRKDELPHDNGVQEALGGVEPDWVPKVPE